MKQTEIGMIPDDWDFVKLGDCGFFSKGKGISREDCNTGTLPAVRYGELYTVHENYLKKFYSFISEVVAKQSKRLKKGDLLFTASGETKEDIGKCVAFLNDFEAYAGGDLIILSPNETIDSLYVGFLANTSICVCQKSCLGQGDAVVHITSLSIQNIKIPLPPLPEQKKIAEVLSDMDNLIETVSTLIEKKKMIRTGTLQKLLTPKADWVEKKLGEIGNVIRGVTFNPELDLDKNQTLGTVCLLRANNIFDSTLNYEKVLFIKNDLIKKNQFMKKGDILICSANGSRALVGKSGILKEEKELTFGAFMSVFRSYDSEDSFFIHFLMRNTPYFKQVEEILSGSTINNLNPKQIEKLKFTIPPTKIEQQRIARILSDMDEEISVLEQKKEKLVHIKQGAMQTLLTGQIRL